MGACTKNAYIFLGPELGKKQDALDSVKKSFKGAEESVFYANDTQAGTIADAIQNMSLFNESRVVIIKNAELIKKKDEVELLSSCINNLESSTAIVFLSDELKLAAGLEEAVPKSNRQVFYELFEKEKNEWIRRFFNRESFTISDDGIRAILELVENNTEALKRECSRIINFLPKDKLVDQQDVERLISHNREESAFTLFSRIAAGDLPKALESMAVMLTAKESAQGILAALVWCFRKLRDYLVLLETSRDISALELKKIGLSSPKAREDYAAAACRYSLEDAESCLAVSSEYDVLLRSPLAALENILMDRYILALFKAASRK